MSVADLKAKGNASFAAKDYQAAIQHYNDAIAAASSPEDNVHVLYSNRSACYAGLKDWSHALDDAESCINANPSFAKGYGRKGAALHGARKLEDAVDAYEAGLKMSPEDAGLKKGLADVKRAVENEAANGPGPETSLGQMFSDPQLFEKLSANPKTKGLLADPAFMAKLKAIQQDPNQASMAFQDPRMIQVMGVLMGIDLQAFERPEGSDELPADLENKRDDIEKQTHTTASASSSKPASAPAPDVEMKYAAVEQEDEDEEKKVKAAADAEKAKGNALYLKRNFESAIPHYEKAWELHHDITYLNNLGACHFEQGNYDQCIASCEKAVDEGRSMRADFKLVAKAYGRIGSAYAKQDKLELAITNFEKALTEHRTPDILAKLRDTEKLLKERTKQAYIDPKKAEEERARGNELYKSGDFPGAVAAFSEAIKRDPFDPRGYTNRASAYTKLAALPEALKDSEEAIKIDPKFVKGYVRKANVLFAMKEYTKAMEACQKAEDADAAQEGGAKNVREIQALLTKCMNEIYSQRSGESEQETLQRAMRDPEVAQIMQDPVMQSILQQAQGNPAALQEHMKSPIIREKVQKLIAAGIIRTR
ncbi:probable STI1 - Hsp90 cochaperone [Melanopsichium pennsylvanicum]|uniref:Probable STI1 - Hsp90 cochaperone n=2 Tax=Melanopsichium pennsylvanicum TaxID=63383 RepID=A0AAJ4XPP0_9BASI|nr:probable STI1-Hsp90 cochaperone [Melanopsichium pennsylvanicum 4]SNX85602.1 probable STI1 - Hsp90 cochaperone [Melanopsichium pennsylvanicum]